MQKSNPAPISILARRLSFDLTGLPPSPERIRELAESTNTDAYDHYVAELLASSAYGERWARHWLDVARYGESNGFEYNEPRRNAWPYRDWVIRALNDDMPFDEFARMQVAGDILKPGDEGAAAVGFLVAGIHNTVLGANGQLQLKARADELEEMVSITSQAFLGITAHCARCHDHKVDPVPTEDYYRLASALSGAWHGDTNQKVAPIFTVAARAPGIMHVHKRGNPEELGGEVTPGGLRAIEGLSPEFGLANDATDAERRRKLAAWMTHRSNALFARVAVNRVWHHHFGTGIVATPNDLGRSGGVASHPELLDWLAGWFQESGYSLKKLHRLIVTSSAYRRSSQASPESLARDSGTRLLWRFPPKRLEAEAIRDSMLVCAGVLNPKMGGPGFEDVREEHFNAGRYFHPIDPEGPEFERRTIYRFAPRGGRSALLDTFDCPDPSTTTPRRGVTTTPLQALSLQNNVFVWRMAEKFGQRIVKSSDPITTAWMVALGREPEAMERDLAGTILHEHGPAALCRSLFNSGEFTLIE